MRTNIDLTSTSEPRPSFTQRLRARRDKRQERDLERAEDDAPIGELRICALTGNPMAATKLQIEVEKEQDRLRKVRRRLRKK